MRSDTCKLGVKQTGWGKQIQNIKITNQLKFHKSDLVIYSHTPLRIQTIKKKTILQTNSILFSILEIGKIRYWQT